MRRTLRWKTAALVVLALVVTGFTLYPLLASRYSLPQPGWLAARRLKLGLDLQGGVQFIVKVDPAPGLAGEGEAGLGDATRRAMTIERVRDTVLRRVDELGTGEMTVAIHGANRDRLLVQVPGFSDAARVKSMLQSPGALEIRLDDTSVVRGADVKGAKVISDDFGLPAVAFTLTPAAGARFAEATSRNIGRTMSIRLDDRVLSTPTIESRIGEQGQIVGSFTAAEAADLAAVLRSGTLPAKLTFLRQELVGATLGAASIRAGMAASAAGLAFVITFLLLYYRWSGVNAVIAMAFNLMLLLGVMSSMGAAMTLPGIAGFVLTIGMGVDSNVLVFERIREELAAGQSIRAAVDAGFRRVFVTLLDTHLAALISAAFLFQFGTSPVRGFAVTLSVGLLTNLFTSTVVSRTLFQLALARQNSKGKGQRAKGRGREEG